MVTVGSGCTGAACEDVCESRTGAGVLGGDVAKSRADDSGAAAGVPYTFASNSSLPGGTGGPFTEHVTGVLCVHTPGVVRSVVTAVPFNAGFALELTRVIVTDVEFGLTYCGLRLELDVVEPGRGRMNVNVGVTYFDC
jgi:hypothetical protein